MGHHLCSWMQADRLGLNGLHDVIYRSIQREITLHNVTYCSIVHYNKRQYKIIGFTMICYSFNII